MENKNINKGVLVVLAIIIIILLALVILLAAGTISFNNNVTSDNNEQTNKNISDNNKDKNKDKKYVNYTSYNVPLYSEKRNNSNLFMKLNVVDGKLKAVIEEETIPVNGIDGQVKSFVFGSDCGSSHYLLAFTTDNKVYFSSYLYDNFADEEGHALNFKEILNDYNIVNITKVNYAGFRTCGNHDFGVVLDNGQIRAINSSNSKIIIGNLDYSQIKYTTSYWPNIVVYNDNTISGLLEDPYNGPIGTKISYNNKDLVLKKYISVSNTNYSYVISKNKLYKLNWHTDEKTTAQIILDNVELVNNSKIDSESLSVSRGENEFYSDQKSDIIKFIDGTSVEITDIQYIYSVK